MLIKRPWHRTGFTIVELLIVIVVIGILAAITIVAYNGIQQKAHVAVVQSDLENAAKQLKIDLVTTGSLPATLAAANDGAGIRASPGTTYQYTVNTSANPQTFCITGTNGTTSYFVTESTSPTIGGCPGDGVGGVAAVTNYAPDPSAEGTINLVASAGTPAISLSTDTFAGWPINGNHSFKIVSGTTEEQRIRPQNNTIPVVANQSIATSAYIYNAASGSRVFQVSFQGRVSGGTAIGNVAATTYTIPAGTLMRVSAVLSYTDIPATAIYIEPMFARELGNGTTASAANDTFYIDNIMLDYSSSIDNYADGSSSHWKWNGTPNDSTSTGPLS